ncbi:MAG: MFS transporter, partial [Pseudomonadota bacterium]
VGVFSLTVIAGGPSYGYLVPGMIIVGIGTGLFFSAVTTAGITSVDASKSSLAGAILYMAQIAGGSIGLALNTAIVASAPSLPSGISRAFLLDGCLAALGVLVSLLFVGGTANPERVKNFIHRHRAHV